MNTEPKRDYKVGERVLFHSPQFPQLAPLPVTIIAVNISMGGYMQPYYKYQDDFGNRSNWYYYTGFQPLITEPSAT